MPFDFTQPLVTVADLRRALEGLPDDAQVLFVSPDGGECNVYLENLQVGIDEDQAEVTIDYRWPDGFDLLAEFGIEAPPEIVCGECAERERAVLEKFGITVSDDADA